jgi:hypothetical protein
VLPDGYLDTQLIEGSWEESLRFIATLKLKHTPASQLFKRLKGYAKQPAWYRGLKQFGQMIQTVLLLKYMDAAGFRQAMEKQLNKMESSPKLAQALSFGHNQELIQGEKEQQEIAEGCRRLIKNAILCWNYLSLAKKSGRGQGGSKSGMNRGRVWRIEMVTDSAAHPAKVRQVFLSAWWQKNDQISRSRHRDEVNQRRVSGLAEFSRDNRKEESSGNQAAIGV